MKSKKALADYLRHPLRVECWGDGDDPVRIWDRSWDSRRSICSVVGVICYLCDE